MNQLKPVPGTRHGARKTFVFKNLPSSPFVFIRYDVVHSSLEPTYDEPFEVIERSEKCYTVMIKGKKI